MNLVFVIISLFALALFAQSLFSLYLMLYSWEHPDRLEASGGPRSFVPPALSFSVLLPARHEEAVIFETIKKIVNADYPRDLLEVVVICHVDDSGTIAEARRAIAEIGGGMVSVATFSDPPINKPHGLNVGLACTSFDVVTIFDAEDDIDSNIFNVVNTVMTTENTGVVQAGVQLMNFRDHWFSVHNCLEYFFWFKSRLHFNAHVGVIPLGGNTVFMRRELLERIGGWDANCLTEDADMGLRLSALSEPIRVVYDAQHVTREETPDSVGAFIKQRTRWHQGFIQILRKGSWRELPHMGQRLLALYTLSYPLFQAGLTLLWPLTVVGLIWAKLPVLVVLIAFLPLYTLVFQFGVTAIGAYLFTKEYGFKYPFHLPITMAVTFVPFQFLMGISAVRAVLREFRRQYNWEKTLHVGAHRQPAIIWSVAFQRLLEEAGTHLGVESGSVLVLDPSANTFAVLANGGVPMATVDTSQRDTHKAVAGWMSRTNLPTLIDGRSLPGELARMLHLPDLRSAIVLPMDRQNQVIGVFSVSNDVTELNDESLRWLSSRFQRLMDDHPTDLIAASA